MEEEEHNDFGLIAGRGRTLLTGRADCNSRSLVPHPSLAIVKFWQGRVEVILRLLSAWCSGLVLGPAVWVLLGLNFPDTGEDAIETSRSETHRVIIWVIIAAGLGVLIQIMVIAGRFLNFEFATSHSSLFHVLDIISNVVFTSAYFTLSIPLFVYSEDLLQFLDILHEKDTIVHFISLRRRYLITAGLCCLSFIQFLVLSVWMSISLSFKWDKKLARYLRQTQTPQAVPPTMPEQV